MKTQFLNLASATLGLALLAVSCTKEAPSKVYPTTMTIDNWEEFVDAPESLLQDFAQKEVAAARYSVATGEEQADLPKCSGGPNFGQVTAWNGSTWVGIQSVDVTQGTWFASTNAWGNYALCASTTGPVCMDYTTPQTNGVSVFDLVIIQRHILGITPFDLSTDNGLRQMVASDVNHDGVIDGDDITAIQSAILMVSPLPGNNVTFVPIVDLVAGVVGDPWGLAFLQNNCRNNASYHMTRRAIKMGDASGNFSF